MAARRLETTLADGQRADVETILKDLREARDMMECVRVSLAGYELNPAETTVSEVQEMTQKQYDAMQKLIAAEEALETTVPRKRPARADVAQLLPPPGLPATPAGGAQGASGSGDTPLPGAPAGHPAGQDVPESWKIENKVCFEVREGYLFCKLCDTYATDGHLRSRKHLKRIKWPATYLGDPDSFYIGQ